MTDPLAGAQRPGMLRGTPLFKWGRALYEWILHWADTRYGVMALFFLAFVEASVFPIPPDALLIALTLGAPTRAFRFAMVCTVGSVLGGLFGYALGYLFWKWVSSFFFTYVFSEVAFFQVQELYQRWDFFAVFTSGFTPIPYKVFTIAAGVFDLNIGTFTLASLCGRAARFFLVAAIIFRYGPPIKVFINRHFEWLTVVFTVLLVGGFVLMRYLP